MVYLLLIVLIGAYETVLSKDYNIKVNEKNTILFSAVICFFAMVFFIINSKGHLDFNIETIPYSLGFGVSFALATFEGLNAIKTGPLALTSLVLSYSLLIPTFHGIIFLDEELKPTMIFGIIALLIALTMVNIKKNEKLVFEKTWIIHVLIAFVSNGMCSTLQKIQQVKFNGGFKNEFMIIALLFVSISLFVLGFAHKGNKKEMFKSALKFGLPKGVANGAKNYFVMIATCEISSSVLFPTISALGMATTFLLSRFRYREYLSKLQIFGYVLGIISVVMLNL